MNKKSTSEKSTRELENVLRKTHISEIHDFLKENSESILSEDRPFSNYMKMKLKEKGLKQQDVFLFADIPERYGYKILSEEKRTRQRDIILRLCYAAKLTLDETQQALRIYKMPELYVKIPRDAILMVCFNERPGSIIDVNAYLIQNNIEPLRTSGIQE